MIKTKTLRLICFTPQEVWEEWGKGTRPDMVTKEWHPISSKECQTRQTTIVQWDHRQTCNKVIALMHSWNLDTDFNYKYLYMYLHSMSYNSSDFLPNSPLPFPFAGMFTSDTPLIPTSARRAMAEQVVCRALGEQPPSACQAFSLGRCSVTARQTACSAIARRELVGISGVGHSKFDIYPCPCATCVSTFFKKL